MRPAKRDFFFNQVPKVKKFQQFKLIKKKSQCFTSGPVIKITTLEPYERFFTTMNITIEIGMLNHSLSKHGMVVSQIKRLKKGCRSKKKKKEKNLKSFSF